MTTAMNVLRRQKSRRQEVIASSDLGVALEQRDLDLVDAIKRLSPRQKNAILLFHLMDLPIADVAAAMGVAPGTVKALLSQGRSNLKQLMGADYE